MKKIIFWISTLLVLLSINLLIALKEETVAHGRSMLLRLAPVDPRSIMQGDYMILDYEIFREVPSDELEDQGCVVVTLDKNNVAKFVRLHQKEELKQNEHLLFYRNRGGMQLGAESFLFQEGDADLYSKARYGELKVNASGTSVLIGLRDEEFKFLGKRVVQ